MEPILSPWVFYWMGTVNNLGTAFGVIGGIGIGGLLIAKLISFVEYDTNQLKTKWFKVCGIIAISLIVLAIIIPTKTTIVEMVAAKQITYDRVDKVIDVSTDIKNTLKQDVMDIIQQINKVETKE